MRDPSSILIAFVLPLVLLFLFGYGVSLDTTRDPRRPRHGGNDAAHPEPCRELRGIALFRRGHRPRPARSSKRIWSSAAFAAFSSSRPISPRTMPPAITPQVQVIVDGSEPNTANFVQNYAQGTVANWERQRQAMMADGRAAHLRWSSASGSIRSSPAGTSWCPARSPSS